MTKLRLWESPQAAKAVVPNNGEKSRPWLGSNMPDVGNGSKTWQTWHSDQNECWVMLIPPFLIFRKMKTRGS